MMLGSDDEGRRSSGGRRKHSSARDSGQFGLDMAASSTGAPHWTLDIPNSKSGCVKAPPTHQKTADHSVSLSKFMIFIRLSSNSSPGLHAV